MKIRELYTDASKWTKGTMARNAENIPSGMYNPSTTCYCLLGAICLCYPTTDSFVHENVRKLWKKLKEINKSEDVIGWNDAPERTFEEVKKLVEELDI